MIAEQGYKRTATQKHKQTLIADIYRGSYRFFNELEEERNARLVRHFITFCKEFNKFKITGARTLDSIYHMTLQLFNDCILGVKTSTFAIYYAAL